MSSSSTRRTEVVIVGGTSGALTAKAISAARARFDPAKHNLTLISQLPYTVFMVSTARMSVTPSPNDLDDPAVGGLFPFDKLFLPGNAGTFLHAQVTAVHETEVELADGKKVPFDYLVVATGSTWSGPMNFGYTTDEQVRAHLTAWREKIAAAKKVVVVGGGAVGIELSGEIHHQYPHTSITLVHALPKLVNPAYKDRFRDALLRKVEANGVRVILNDRVLDVPDQGLSALDDPHMVQVTTEGGRVLEADLVIPAFGPRPNTSLLKSLRAGSALTAASRVRVTKTLNVQFTDGQVSPNIWAIGDIIDWNEQHTFGKGVSHSAVVAENVLRAIEDREAEAQGAAKKTVGKVYKGMPEVILVTFGPTGGILYIPFLWGLYFGDWAARLIKAKTLFIPRFRKAFGL